MRGVSSRRRAAARRFPLPNGTGALGRRWVRVWEASLFRTWGRWRFLAGTCYVGGTFTSAGGSAAMNIAKWNGSAWSALGSGLGGGSGNYLFVYALAVSGSDLYAGSFTTAGGKV